MNFCVHSFGNIQSAHQIKDASEKDGGGSGDFNQSQATKYTNRGGRPDKGGSGEAVYMFGGFDDDASAQKTDTDNNISNHRKKASVRNNHGLSQFRSWKENVGNTEGGQSEEGGSA